MNNKNEKVHIPFASKSQLIACIVLAPIAVALYAILREFTQIESVFIALAISALYLLTVTLIIIHHGKYVEAVPSEGLQQLLSQSGSVVFKNSQSPMMIIDSYGTILWYNEAMHGITDSHGNYIDSNIISLFEQNITKEQLNGKPVSLFGKTYTMESFELANSEEELYLSVLSDITAFTEIQKKYTDERVAIAYIAIDNVEEILQYVHEKFRDAVSSVDDTLKEWADSMNGIVKSYDNDKYIMIFDSAKLDECIENRFEILDKIRNSRVGDGVSITASIGISRISGTLKDRENAAREAIDMALQRGGDQVVYKTEDKIEYYGGRTKSLYKRSNVRSRTFANQLTATMARADNVIVMGHKYGDFDSFGASLGVVRLAMLLGIKVNIAVDMRDSNIHPCVDVMQSCEGYEHIFVDSAEAFDLVGPDTLVVLVDHNTLNRAQFSDIAMRVRDVVVIDHHRKTDVMPETVRLSYIEPSASSTCELLAEMLEAVVVSNNILKEEADFLLAGILLDTKQFTRNTGTRTFAAAQYLRSAGASPSDVYDMFKTDAKDLAKEARFHTKITVYRDNIAISSCEGDTDETYRVIASKAADKMLTLKNVDAAFTLVSIGEQIHISGRSNGRINVQLILEKLKGGGHFDIAGAQIKSESITEVLDTLKESIDEYLNTNNENFNQ